MANFYLEFEKPLKDIDGQIFAFSSIADLNNDDIRSVAKLKEERAILINKIYSGLSRWQRIQLARHPNRPYSMDYFLNLCPDFIELHGDRHFMDDPAVITGLGTMGQYKIALIGQQKGRNTKENLYRNFGMMRPEGYRKAMRIMKLAEKFNLPVITLMDTIGAYPGIGAEERGQGEAIARNLMEMSSLRVPIVSVVIGEGASGGALGIGVCDKMLMMENSWYSVISPEGCASILFRDAKRAEDAAEALKPIPTDLEKMGICERIIEEPNGGAHRDFESSSQLLKAALIEELDILSKIDPSEFLDNRIKKYDSLGIFEES
ncbi:MAG: acetyl-CoA carboxylase carboxyltransferase subunit alpha [Candidatus Neomarinimicrobiota bacterium]